MTESKPEEVLEEKVEAYQAPSMFGGMQLAESKPEEAQDA